MDVGLTPSQAAQIVQVGMEVAERTGAPLAVAIVDAGCRLVAFARTSDATGAAVDCAPAKARTAVWFGRPTADTLAMAEARPVVYETLIGASPQPLVLSMGGIPVRVDGTLVGAVAAAGALTGAIDIEVAEAMAAAWHELVTG